MFTLGISGHLPSSAFDLFCDYLSLPLLRFAQCLSLSVRLPRWSTGLNVLMKERGTIPSTFPKNSFPGENQIHAAHQAYLFWFVVHRVSLSK